MSLEAKAGLAFTLVFIMICVLGSRCGDNASIRFTKSIKEYQNGQQH